MQAAAPLPRAVPVKTLADPGAVRGSVDCFLCWSLAERPGARAQDWAARDDLDETAQAVCIPTRPRQPLGAASRLGLNLLHASAASPGPQRGAGGSSPPSAALLGRLCRGQRGGQAGSGWAAPLGGPGPGSGARRDRSRGGCSCFSVPVEPCPDRAHRAPLARAR